MTGLSKPTVNEIVTELTAEHLVQEVGPDDHGARDRPGPRPRLIAFRPDYGYVVGIDVGASKLLVLLADLEGTIIGSARSAARKPRGPKRLIKEADQMVRGLLAKHRVDIGRVKAISVGMPGVVNPRTQRVTLAPQIPGWEGVDLGAILRAQYPCPVLIDTEDGLSMLAEHSLGVGRGMDDLLYINIGIGLGAGILVAGQVYRGASGAAGAIGHLPVADGAVEEARDGFGSFEVAAGGMAYARLGREVARTSRGRHLLALVGGDPSAIDAEVVFRAGGQGDPAALEIIDELAGRLANGVAGLVVALDPAAVIIGGGVSRAGPVLLDALERQIRRVLPQAPRLLLSVLGEDAAALGAVTAAVRHWESGAYAMPAAEEV
jgi:glucokinase